MTPDPRPGRVFDISWPIRSGMAVWPGDAPCTLAWTARRGQDSAANVAALGFSAHAGTHADGPLHVIDDGAPIGEVPLDAYLGPARVVDVATSDRIDEAAVAAAIVGRPRRVLFRTGCWTSAGRFPEAFPAIVPAAARRLVDAGVRLVGTDAPSVDPPDSAELETHRVLAAAGCAILENLLLRDVAEGEYELIALPLRLMEADASPVRAVLRSR
jgi:arylformamidase